MRPGFAAQSWQRRHEQRRRRPFDVRSAATAHSRDSTKNQKLRRPHAYEAPVPAEKVRLRIGNLWSAGYALAARWPALPTCKHMTVNRRCAVGIVLSLMIATACGADDDETQAPPAPASTSEAREAPAEPPAADGGPVAAFVSAEADAPVVNDGDDWTLPDWVRPAPNSGFFSEDADPAHAVFLRSVDVSWRQLAPEPGVIDMDATGEAQGLSFDSLAEQLDAGGPYWMRVFASGVDWAPEWVADECDVATYGPDYDDQEHLPIWDDCVWGHLRDTYELLFVDEALAAHPNLRFVYMPGAFTWVEYDYDIVNDAVERGELEFDTYYEWYGTMLDDLGSIFGEHAYKVVFTGEDYPFGPFDADDDLHAREAVDAGFGIRTGITELFNYHLSEAPAYGSHVQPDGHLVVADDEPPHDGRRIVATENECYTDCGYETEDVYYAVRQSNLKALQLRMNWIYVVPEPSRLDEYAEHWDWVRLSMGHTANDSADAWAALRDAEDAYWNEDDAIAWDTAPYVRNLERWLVQRDRPGCIAHRSEVDVVSEEVASENGTAYEGLSTARDDEDTAFCFDLDDAFLDETPIDVVVKVTYLDQGDGSFVLEHGGTTTAAVERSGTDEGEWRTATIMVPALAAGPDDVDFTIQTTDGDDLVVRFVRVVKLAAPDV